MTTHQSNGIGRSPKTSTASLPKEAEVETPVSVPSTQGVASAPQGKGSLNSEPSISLAANASLKSGGTARLIGESRIELPNTPAPVDGSWMILSPSGTNKTEWVKGPLHIGEDIPGSGGNVSDAVNSHYFIGQWAQAGVLVIYPHNYVTIGYDGIAYRYVGLVEREIGSGKGPDSFPHYHTQPKDWVVISSADHAALQNRNTSDQHPQSAITDLLEDQATQDIRLDTLEDRGTNWDNKDVQQDGRLDVLETRADETDTEQVTQDTRLNTLETKADETDTEQGVQDGRLATLESKADETDTEQGVQDGRLDAVEAADGVQDIRLDTAEQWQSDHDGAYNPHGKMTWKGDWAPGTFQPYDMAVDGSYAGVANKQTTDRLAPQDAGAVYNIYDGASPTSAITAKQLTVGQRYTWGQDGKLTGFRLYTVTGNLYRVYAVKDPLGDGIIVDVLSQFTADSTGWSNFPIDPVIGYAGQVFDLYTAMEEPDPIPTTWTANYNYTTPQNSTAPAIGVAEQANSTLDIIRFNKTDNDGLDHGAGSGNGDLLALVAGDVIDAVGARWAIQAAPSDQGTYVEFVVAPSQQGAPDGVAAFTFETVVATPITVVVDTDFWLGNAACIGRYQIDGGAWVDSEAQYSIDIEVQPITISLDWDLLPQGGGGSSGGGEAGPPGADGTIWHNGTTSPPNVGIGVDGDFYIDTVLDQYFGPKTSESWVGVGPYSLEGPQGPQGDPGTTDHTLLSNRDAADQHPPAAITDLDSYIDARIAASDNVKWPVGSLYLTTTGVNPNTFLPGVWEVEAEGRVLIGVGTLGLETYNALATGGTAFQTLTEAQMPSHDHSPGWGSEFVNFSGLAGGIANIPAGGDNKVNIATATATAGSDNAFDNRMPYIAVYIWHRAS